MDADGRQQNLDALVEQIEAGERDLTDADRDAILDFNARLELHRSNYGVHRHEKLLRHATIAAERAKAVISRSGPKKILTLSVLNQSTTPINMRSKGLVETPNI